MSDVKRWVVRWDGPQDDGGREYYAREGTRAGWFSEQREASLFTRREARREALLVAGEWDGGTVKAVRLVSRAEAVARARAAGLREAASILEDAVEHYEGDESVRIALDKIEKAARCAGKVAK